MGSTLQLLSPAGRDELRELWEANREEILQAWKEQGKKGRPWSARKWTITISTVLDRFKYGKNNLAGRSYETYRSASQERRHLFKLVLPGRMQRRGFTGRWAGEAKAIGEPRETHRDGRVEIGWKLKSKELQPSNQNLKHKGFKYNETRIWIYSWRNKGIHHQTTGRPIPYCRQKTKPMRTSGLKGRWSSPLDRLKNYYEDVRPIRQTIENRSLTGGTSIKTRPTQGSI